MHGDQSSTNSRNTTVDLFGEGVMVEIAANAGLTDPAQVARLQGRLQAIGTEFRRVIATTPNDLPGRPSTHTHSERLDWLDTQVLNPIEKLLGALDPSQRHMLSLWPNEVVDELMPDFDEVRRQVEHLQLLAQNLAITIVMHRKADLPFGPLIRFQIVAATASILDELAPNLKPSRGTYDATTKQYYGHYPAIIRRVFLEITGLHEQLDRLIQEQVDHRRKG